MQRAKEGAAAGERGVPKGPGEARVGQADEGPWGSWVVEEGNF